MAIQFKLNQIQQQYTMPIALTIGNNNKAMWRNSGKFCFSII